MEKEDKQPEIDKEKYHFEKLTPFSDADISKYKEMLDFALIIENNDDVTNVAMTGLYGSGKSSVIETYKKQRKGMLNFLSISLSHYDGTNDIGTKDLEGKIVNQLLHQIKRKKIPKTIFKAKSNISRFSIISYTLGIVFLLGMIYGWFNKIASIKNFLLSNFPSSFLMNFIKTGWFDAVWFLVIGVVLFVLLYKLIKLQANEKLIKALTVSGNSVEILQESKESYFDKFMNDVIYLFANSGADVIVFEDLDRFNDPTIYEKLQEINILANKRIILDKNFSRWSRIKKEILHKLPIINKKSFSRKLSFLYLIRDDAFESKDRTKFFDFVIPIVTTMDGSNSYSKFIEIFERMKIDKDFNPSLLKKLSLYIDDYRLLKNVANEYFVYEGRINGAENSLNLNKDKLLALVIYKNLFPKDFSELQYGKSYLNSILSKKNDLIEKEKNEIKSKIEEIIVTIRKSEEEALESINELDALYLNLSIEYDRVVDGKHEKDFNNKASFIQAVKDAKYEIKQKMVSSYYDNYNNYNLKQDFDNLKDNEEYTIRRINLENKNKENFDRLLTQKEKLERKISNVQSTSMRDLLSEETDDLFTKLIESSEVIGNGEKNNKGETKFSYLQKSDYFPLLRLLVREELIDDKYSDYMTYFYKGDLSRNDRSFIRSVYDLKPEEYSYHLDNPEKVISDISEEDFARYGVKNIDLSLWILQNDKSHEKHYSLLIDNLKQHNGLDFLYKFYEKSKNENEHSVFFTKLHKYWPDFVIRLINDTGQFDDSDKLRYVSDYLISMDYDSLASMNEIEKLVQYVGSSKLLSSNYISKEKLTELLPSLSELKVSFMDITEIGIDLDIVREVVKLKMFNINKENIVSMIQSYNESIPSDELTMKAYTSIKSLNNDEINEALFNMSRFSKFLSQYLEFGNNTLQDDANDIADILNSQHVKEEAKLAYINRLLLNPKLESISNIKNEGFWQEIVNKQNLLVSSKNILILFKKNEWELNEDLVKFINFSEDAALSLNIRDLNEDEIKKIFNEIVVNVELKESIYVSLLRSLKLTYNSGVASNIPSTRIKVLIENSIIPFSSENLISIRRTFLSNLIDFVIVNFDKYIEEIVSEPGVDNDEELVYILETNQFSIEQSKRIIDNIIETVRLNPNYTDEINEYIMENKFNGNDLDVIVDNYSEFSDTLATAVYDLVSKEQYLEKLIDRGRVIPKELLDSLLANQDINEENRNWLILNNMSDMIATELNKYPSIPQEFLDVLHRKKIEVPNTEINSKFAEVYKEKDWVTKVEEIGENIIIQGRKIL